MKFLFVATGRWGSTFWETLSDRDFQQLRDQQYDYYHEQSLPGRETREAFINWIYDNKLDGDQLDAIKKIARVKGKNNRVKEWLFKNVCPCLDEEKFRKYWADIKTNEDAEDGVLWEMNDQEDDIEVARNFGYITYPPYKDGTYVNGGSNCIPPDVANHASKIYDDSRNIASKEERDSLYKKATALEKEAFENLLLIKGYTCPECDSEIEMKKAVPLKAIPKTNCGTVFCKCLFNNSMPESAEAGIDYLLQMNGAEMNCGCRGKEYRRDVMAALSYFDCPLPTKVELKTAQFLQLATQADI